MPGFKDIPETHTHKKKTPLKDGAHVSWDRLFFRPTKPLSNFDIYIFFSCGSKRGIFFSLPAAAALDSSVRNVIRSQEEFPRLSQPPAAERRSSAGSTMGDAADDGGMRRTFIVPAIKSFDHYDFTRAKISCSLTWLVAKAFGSGRWRLLSGV